MRGALICAGDEESRWIGREDEVENVEEVFEDGVKVIMGVNRLRRKRRGNEGLKERECFSEYCRFRKKGIRA